MGFPLFLILVSLPGCGEGRSTLLSPSLPALADKLVGQWIQSRTGAEEIEGWIFKSNGKAYNLIWRDSWGEDDNLISYGQGNWQLSKNRELIVGLSGIKYDANLGKWNPSPYLVERLGPISIVGRLLKLSPEGKVYVKTDIPIPPIPPCCYK